MGVAESDDDNVVTEVWFRNPDSYIRELAEVGVGRIAWDRGYLTKKRIDPVLHAELYLGHLDWRSWAIGPQGTAEYRAGDLYGEPSAVYPTFAFGGEARELEDLVAYPAGEDESQFNSKLPRDERPVQGQDHRVIVTDIPNMRTAANRSFLRLVAELQEEYQSCTIHLHGLYGFRTMFSMPFRSVDFEARTTAQKGKVVTPAGREMQFERLAAHSHWATMLNMRPADLAIPRNRCMYNIRSAIWAGEHFRQDIQYRVRGSQKSVDVDYTEASLAVQANREAMSDSERRMADEVLAQLAKMSGVTDSTTPKQTYKAPTTSRNTARARKGLTSGSPSGQDGDYFHCNTCSMAAHCKFYREGSVCSVPSSETSPLAKLFGSRDSDQIIDGLGMLLQKQAERIEDGEAQESEFDELNPEVNKMINALFSNGVKLAKLINPALNGGPKVNVNVGVGQGGQAAVMAGNPNQLMGSIVRALEERGIPRDQITPEMVQGVLAGMGGGASATPAIEGHVITHESGL